LALLVGLHKFARQRARREKARFGDAIAQMTHAFNRKLLHGFALEDGRPR
jgi:hypothetical protein